MRIFSYFILFVVVVFGFTFACLNSSAVTLHYYLGEADLPLSLLLVLTLLLGIILGMLVTLGYTWQLYWQLRQTKHQLATTKASLTKASSSE